MTPSRDIARLLDIMAQLRTPGTGCPWDLEQDFATIAPYTIEEAYEVADAIARDDLGDLCDELGDLLLQVVFHARMAEEQNAFSFGDVVEAITRKMIRRHPHVFADSSAPARGRGFAGVAVIQRQGGAAGAGAGDAIAAQGLQRRLRLERSARGSAQDSRGSRRDRGRA
jgi:NTP pyrophosphatase (non-canonical NTP hydrolase)